MSKFTSLFRSVLILSLALGTFACKDNTTPEDEAGKLSVSRQSVVFNADGGDESLTVTANKAWTSTKDAAWLTVTPAEGDGTATVKLTAAANATIEERSGKVEFKIDGTVLATVTVTQNPHGTALTVTADPPLTDDAVELPAAADTLSFEVRSNGDAWDVTVSPIPETATEWLSVVPDSKTDSEVVFASDSNFTIEAREALVVFTLTDYPTVKKEIVVTQAAYEPVLTITPATAAIGAAGSSVILEIESSDPWEIDIPEGDTWLTVTAQTETTVTLTGEANDGAATRESDVTFFLTDYTGTTKTVKITQGTQAASVTIQKTGPEPYAVKAIGDLTDGLKFTWEVTEGTAPSGYKLIIGKYQFFRAGTTAGSAYGFNFVDSVEFAATTTELTLTQEQLSSLLGTTLKGDIFYWTVKSIDGPTVRTEKWNQDAAANHKAAIPLTLTNYDAATAIPPKAEWTSAGTNDGSSITPIYHMWDNQNEAWNSATGRNGSATNPLWVVIDLGKTATISGVTYRPRSHASWLGGDDINSGPRNVFFEIGDSKDGPWTKFIETELPNGIDVAKYSAERGTEGTKKDTDLRADAPVTGRYVKLSITTAWSPWDKPNFSYTYVGELTFF
ncbi:MAG: discoidin domain-containing protein [Bacteroidales bacterium]|jgi:hypothetical protein|nr:discoidin domain-containing protein [Bacteroidales bacterium]